MAKLWTANKSWVNDSPNANTEYLVGAANGGCNYQSIPQGGTKRILVSNGANGNVAYGNRSVPLPDMQGNVDDLPPADPDLLGQITVPLDEHYHESRSVNTTASVTYNSSLKCYEWEQAGSKSDFEFSISFDTEALANQYFDVISSITRIEVWNIRNDKWMKIRDITGLTNYSILKYDNYQWKVLTTTGTVTRYVTNIILGSLLRIVPFK